MKTCNTLTLHIAITSAILPRRGLFFEARLSGGKHFAACTCEIHAKASLGLRRASQRALNDVVERRRAHA